MGLVWHDWEELMRWQPDNEYIPSNFEAVAHINLACECWRNAHKYYAMLRG